MEFGKVNGIEVRPMTFTAVSHRLFVSRDKLVDGSGARKAHLCEVCKLYIIKIMSYLLYDE